MLDGYHILTLTHRHASLDAIGRSVVRSDESHEPAAVLQDLKNRFEWKELFYLATCNRVMYLFYTNEPISADLPETLLAAVRPELTIAEITETASNMQLLHGADAVRHLMEVASSMDSLVVGEREVIRQLREAWDRSHAWGLTGDHLRLLLRFTIETAKEVYTETGIGQKALSVVALAFGALQRTGLPTDARILLIGAGQTNALFAKFLLKYGYHNVTVFNRTLSKAEVLAATLGARALPLDALEQFSGGFDALVVCTGATEPVITPELYRRLIDSDTNSKTVVDLAIPNNVDKRIPEDFSVHFIEIEGLREAAQQNLAHREQERAKAGAIIQRRILAYRDLWHERQVERAMAHIPDEVRAVKDRAIQQVFGKEFAQLDPAAQDVVLRMMGYMEKKCIAIPIKAAKAIALGAMRGRKREVSEKI